MGVVASRTGVEAAAKGEGEGEPRTEGSGVGGACTAGGGVRKVLWERVLCGDGVGTRLLIVDVGEDAVSASVGSKRTWVGVMGEYGIRMLDCNRCE